MRFTRTISIHAPRVGSDEKITRITESAGDFNPRSPCGERLPPKREVPSHQEFQSTLPVWGATWRIWFRDGDLGYFNPRSPCGERPSPEAYALLRKVFQSTLPVWGATSSISLARPDFTISIHAPRVGSDSGGDRERRRLVNFNPRSPCGERHMAMTVGAGPQDFNPRSPCGERLWSW